jgi:hypothetical protein
MPDVLPDMYFRAFQVDIFNSQSRLHVAQRKDGSLLAWRNWRVVPVNAPEVGSYGQELAITDINSLSISLTTQTASSPGRERPHICGHFISGWIQHRSEAGDKRCTDQRCTAALRQEFRVWISGFILAISSKPLVADFLNANELKTRRIRTACSKKAIPQVCRKGCPFDIRYRKHRFRAPNSGIWHKIRSVMRRSFSTLLAAIQHTRPSLSRANMFKSEQTFGLLRAIRDP